MSSPIPEPTEHDKLQDAAMAEILAMQDELRKKANTLGIILDNQGIYVPPTLREEEPGPLVHPLPPVEMKQWGGEGYSIWPVNGRWVSLRAPECEYMRLWVSKVYDISKELFFKRRIRVRDDQGNFNFEILDVPFEEQEQR